MAALGARFGGMHEGAKRWKILLIRCEYRSRTSSATDLTQVYTALAPQSDFTDLNEKEKSKNTPPSVTLADDMPDDDDKPTPIPFTGDVTVDRTRVPTVSAADFPICCR